MEYSDKYMAYMGMAPRQIPHWEHWSCPDAETYLTGIDYYEHRYIFPRYEEFWGILKAAGKEVIFMVDGCIDAYADDVFACGARGIITEPYTDFKTIARKHKDCFLAGEGDNRILTRNNPHEIEAMVKSMVETANMTGGYMMCIGNHVPWNVTPEGIKRYLDLSSQLAHR